MILLISHVTCYDPGFITGVILVCGQSMHILVAHSGSQCTQGACVYAQTHEKLEGTLVPRHVVKGFQKITLHAHVKAPCLQNSALLLYRHGK